MKLLHTEHTPIELIAPNWANGKAAKVYVLREDQNHPLVQGNKWYKLQPALKEVEQKGLSGIATFGGAYSNHLYATAAACASLGLQSVGIVRGTWADPANKTLQAVQNFGMRLHFIPASLYSAGVHHLEIQHLLGAYPDLLVLPEGALQAESIRTCAAIGDRLRNWKQKYYPNTETHIWVAIGTGGTAAGILHGLAGSAHLHIVAPTTSGVTEGLILDLLRLAALPEHLNYTLHLDYCFGGFARRNATLDAFIRDFYEQTQVLPDPVYTCKVFYALADQLAKGSFTPGAVHLVVHTGGLQGWNQKNCYVIE